MSRVVEGAGVKGWGFRVLLSAVVLLLLAASLGCESRGPVSPAVTSCRELCDEQERACEAGCHTPKSGADAANVDCSTRCTDRQMECLHGC